MGMMTKHISSEQIKEHIENLEAKIESVWRRFGRETNHRKCRWCGTSESTIGTKGHGMFCWVRGLISELEHYKGLLEKQGHAAAMEPLRVCR